ncbi:MAG: hypothetical protein ACXW4T_03820 [Candidatus Limnocylindrales bacterium]
MDEMDDHRSPDTGHANGTKGPAALESITPIGSGSDVEATSSAEEAPARHTQAPAFLTELAHAMQAAADRERERIASVVAEEASVHVEKVRSRAALETDELRRLAEEDVTRIEEWSASEIERVRAEAAQKTSDRRASLEEYLHQHDAIIASEIEGVDGAVRDYGVTLETFFAGLADSNDPSEIVRRAETLPAPPDLDEVRAAARSEAVGRFAGPAAPESTDAESTGDAATATDTGDTTDASAGGETVEAVAIVEPVEATATAETDGARMPDQAEATADASTPAGDEDDAGPVGVMDPSTAPVAGWPADDRLAIAQTTDHASAAVRLLRTVAPWTAPVHAGEPEPPTDPD